MLLAALLLTAAVSPSYSQTPSFRDISGLEEVYQSIDSQPKLTIADKYDQKMKVLTDTLAAGDAYTSAFEDLAAYTEIARETGAFLTPGFGAKLLEFQTRLEGATKNRAFEAYGKVSKVNAYATQAVSLVSEVDVILGDENLTPSGRRSLAALKGLGVAMQTFGEKVPGIGKGLEILGQITSELTGVVRGTAQNIVDLRGGTFAPGEERRLGLESGSSFGYIRTSLYNQGLPVVQELINEKKETVTKLRTEDGKWQEVNYAEVSAIWSEYRFANGRGPTASEVVTLLGSPVRRDSLQAKARARVNLLHAQRLIDDFQLPGLSPTTIQSNERELQGILQNLGLVVPKNSSAFNLLLKNRLVDPHLDDQSLTRMAVSAHPGAGDYFKWRGLDPAGMSLEELGSQLITYRVSGHRQYAAHLRAATAPPVQPPAATVASAPPVQPPAATSKPALGAPAVRDQKPGTATTKATCDDGQATVAQGREAYAKWQAVGREKTPWVFVCGSWSRYTPCIPSSYAWVWKEVDGKVPEDQWEHSIPAACDAAYRGPSIYDFQQCVWKEYLAKLDTWAAKKTAECRK